MGGEIQVTWSHMKFSFLSTVSLQNVFIIIYIGKKQMDA